MSHAPARSAAIAASLCLASLPVAGQGLRGQWSVEAPSLPDYSATLLVDGASRAAWDDAQIRTLGYVAKASDVHAAIILTDRNVVVHLQCSRTGDHMDCYSFAPKGVSILFKLTRVGPGPQSLRPERP